MRVCFWTKVDKQVYSAEETLSKFDSNRFSGEDSKQVDSLTIMTSSLGFLLKFAENALKMISPSAPLECIIHKNDFQYVASRKTAGVRKFERYTEGMCTRDDLYCTK